MDYPLARFADLRTDSAAALATSMLWQQFQVDAINEFFRGEVKHVDADDQQ